MNEQFIHNLSKIPADYEVEDEFTEMVNKKMKRFQIFVESAGFSAKDYQEQGVRWCLRKELKDRSLSTARVEKRGGFLTDEMGLGKTMMMIGTIFANHLPGRSTLIVLPVALIKQWQAEIFRTTGNEAVIYHGQGKSRITQKDLEDAPIVLTSYGSLSPSIKNSLLTRVDWFRVVFDEAHHLRNSDTNIFLGAKSLQFKIGWLVTGTPIQNKFKDFVTLASILNMTMSLKDETEITSIMEDCIMKRTKKSVGIDLPDFVEENVLVSWGSESERCISEEFHPLNFIRISDDFDINTEKRSCAISNAVQDIYQIDSKRLVQMIKSRQMCILPKLAKGLLDKIQPMLEEKISQMPEDSPECAYLKNTIESIKKIDTYSSKMNAVVEKLLNSGECGKLIFCQFRDEMDELRKRLIDNGIRHENIGIIDGRLSLRKRNELIQSHPTFLILQIQTTNEGLNLQEHYSQIYFVSPNWNPAVEYQSISRCHRIGQEHQVFVFRFQMDSVSQMERYEQISIDKYITEKQMGKVCLYI